MKMLKHLVSYVHTGHVTRIQTCILEHEFSTWGSQWIIREGLLLKIILLFTSACLTPIVGK